MGLIFGSGLIISFVVGIMVVYQTLATQVSRQLPQFATLKAIGYRDRSLDGTVITISLLIVIVAFVPALAAARRTVFCDPRRDAAPGCDDLAAPRRRICRHSRQWRRFRHYFR